MNSGYFAQYLLNEGFINDDEAGRLLRASTEKKAGISLSALRSGMISPEHLETLAARDGEEFLHAAAKNGMLSAAQVEELRSSISDDDLNFAQVLLDENRADVRKIKELFDACDALEASPVRQVVLDKAAKAELFMEADRYADFSELFVRSFKRFMQTPVIVKADEPITESAELSHIVSQRLLGDVTMVTGIHAQDDVFLEMARRFSGEDITEVDELTVDSLCEFLNVINGLFAVDVARQELEIDLDAPRVAENSYADGNLQLVLLIETGFGKFALVLAGDEFVLHSVNE